MPSAQVSPKTGSAKMSTMAIAWGLVAGVAYLGLINKVVVNANSSSLGLSLPTTDDGLLALKVPNSVLPTLSQFAVGAIAVAILATLAFGLATRLRPTQGAFPSLLIVSGIVGIVGSGLVFLDVVASDNKNRSDLVVAIGTIVAVAVLLRVQRFVRRFYQRSPAAASLVVGAFIIIYLFLTNGTSIFTILLRDLDIYLALSAFAVVIYAGYQTTRHGQRLRRGK